MTVPPGSLTHRRSSGTTTGKEALTGNQINLMTAAAHRALVDAGVMIGPSKVSKIIRRFGKAISRHGMTFHEFLSVEADLSPAQRLSVVGHPEWRRCIAYTDPTGEAAVNTVMRERGH